MKIFKLKAPYIYAKPSRSKKYDDCSDFNYLLIMKSDQNRYIRNAYEGELKEVLLYFMNLKNRTNEETKRMDDLKKIVISEHNMKISKKLEKK